MCWRARTAKCKLVDGDIRNYNYLNWMENFADMGHAVVLHGLVVRDLPKSSNRLTIPA